MSLLPDPNVIPPGSNTPGLPAERVFTDAQLVAMLTSGNALLWRVARGECICHGRQNLLEEHPWSPP